MSLARLQAVPADAAAVPPPAPIGMPDQDLGAAPEAGFAPPAARTLVARAIVFGGTPLLTYAGYRQMLAVFDPERISSLQMVLLALVTVTVAWIGFAALAAVAGWVAGPWRRPAEVAPGADGGRCALLMPLYDEDPGPSFAALQAMGEGLVGRGAGEHYEIFVVSDTRDPDVWVRETAALARLRAALGEGMRVWYRRREANHGRKAGNLRAFVEDWGGRYETMLVLDADSVMDPDTIITMSARMAAAPRLGILQSVPMLAGGRSLFGRLQQFAGRLYAPVIAAGTAAWQGEDGNYWGHNAMIRVRAFAEACGLPDLPGRRPFGGHILSHDFVEAALMRRAGWEVRMDPDLAGSYEGAPPSLLDLAARDRRWAQGNLQHAKVIGARGLRWPNRVHFAIGIGAYLMSAVWLAMIVTGLVLSAQAMVREPVYFTEAFQLFPDWPVFDAARMLALLVIALGLLMLPKAMGLARALVCGRTARAFGGRLRLLAGFVVEVVVSALYAPVLMLMQVAQLVEVLRGRDSGWSAQVRDGAMAPWRLVLARHWHHSLAGLVPAAALAVLAPPQLVWLAPVLAGLALAPVASRLSGSVGLGDALAALGVLVTPEDREPPAVLARAAALRPGYAAATGGLGLARLAEDAAGRARHVAALGPGEAAGDRLVWMARLTARAKLEAVEDPGAALALLTADERRALAASPGLLALWARSPEAPAAGLSLAGE
jgi:membrane glycosyltransferase